MPYFHVQAYCAQAGLPALPGAVLADAARHLTSLRGTLASVPPPAGADAVEALYAYAVPRLGEGGACSLHGELDPEPFRLDAALGGRSLALTLQLARIHAALRFVNERVGADWLGVYARRDRAPGADGPALVKLAYLGVPSRAVFPLDEAFARGSNNSAVGLSGRARVIASVAGHVAAGGAYYSCDPHVRSEVCLPLFRADGSVCGILDAESFAEGHFNPERVADLAVLAVAAAELLPAS